MPVEIRELVIKAEISPQKGGEQAPPEDAKSREHLVRDCVAQVLEILRERKER